MTDHTPDAAKRQPPPSKRIADELRRAIDTGELPPGSQLPSERELARSHGTARNTARQAIQILLAEGLVEAQHGRGVFVRPPRAMVRLGHDRYSRRYRQKGIPPFRAEAERQGFTPRVEVRDIGPVPAPGWVAERLKLSEGDNVLRRRNRYYADDRPVQLADTYIPLPIAGQSPLHQAETGPGGIYQRLEEQGHRLVTFREDITARMPRPDETDTLAIPPGVPIIELLHTSHNQHGDPFEITHIILPADRNGLTYELPAD
ncbi:MAG: GntR family transcriptional regulator [Egibacteraceae bacterium]